MGKLAKRKIDIRKKNYLYHLSIVYTTLFRKWLKCSLQLCIASPFRKKEAFVRWNIPVKCFNDIIKRHQKPNIKKLCGFATLLINQNKISNFRFYEQSRWWKKSDYRMFNLKNYRKFLNKTDRFLNSALKLGTAHQLK